MSGDPTIDLNADAGEGFDTPELFAAISTASVACGGHAGDDATMRAALELAKASGVAVGAHPGYEDRASFGRVETRAGAAEIERLVLRQTTRLAERATEVGLRLAHVKPHGALYHRLWRDPEAARAVAAALARLDPGLAVLAEPGSRLLAAAAEAGLAVVREGFVDRRYAEDGSLVPRSEPGAVLGPDESVAQAVRLAAGPPRPAVEVATPRDPPLYGSLCLHSDSTNAPDIARAVRRSLEAHGFVVASFAPEARRARLEELHVVGAAIVEGGRVLLTRRSPRMSMPGKWEFPGGKVEPAETSAGALAREVAEELGLAIEIGGRIGRGTALHDGRRIVLEVYEARRAGGALRLAEHEEHGWFGAEQLDALDWPEADLPVLPALARRLG
jgi:UPF0271 protein